MSEAEVSALCQQLAAAATLMMDPTAPREHKLEAFHKCEDFKRTSPLADRCGLALAADKTAANPVVRHFGLKILEDVIKLRWNEMGGEQKVFMKESCMRMAGEGTADLLDEAAHIKDGVAR